MLKIFSVFGFILNIKFNSFKLFVLNKMCILNLTSKLFLKLPFSIVFSIMFEISFMFQFKYRSYMQ